jgi:hypothetical protein
MSRQSNYTALGGGLDLVSPRISMPAGHCLAASNHEPSALGYRRIDGFERFDGRTRPSKASYWVLNFDAGTTAVAEGDTVTGATSGATGIALVAGVVTSGTLAGGDAAGYLVLTEVAGTFQDDEALQVSAATVAVANGSASERGASNDTDDTTWIQDAIETAREKIGAVPGSGDIRGVWVYNGDVYAFRDNAGATACVMHKATAAGWVEQDLGYVIEFTGGQTSTTEPPLFPEGNTLTGNTSGATGTITRTIIESGAISSSDAAGSVYLTNVTGTFQVGELMNGGGVATCQSDATPVTLPAGGRYEFVTHNFYGASDLKRMYGCNGVGMAFEWDGSVFVQIKTGMDTDTPTHIAAHYNHLFLGFPGGSLQHSSIGNPYEWSPLTGAGEIGIGEDLTGLMADVAGAMVAFGRNKIAVLYGTDSASWQLKTFSNDSGAIAHSGQKIGNPIYLDDRGLRSLTTTQAFGDFKAGTLTQLVEPLFATKRRDGVTVAASCRVRSKDQYRLFWSDGTALVLWLGGKAPAAMPLDLGKVVKAICSSESATGEEVIYFGSTDGYVYQMDSGTSFDGSAIDAFVRLAHNHAGTPTQSKRWLMAHLELDSGPETNLGVVADFQYSDPDLTPYAGQNFTVRGGGGHFNEDTWDDFYWSSPSEGVAQAHIDGTGTNCSVVVVSSATFEQPYTLHGLILHYSPRRVVR